MKYYLQHGKPGEPMRTEEVAHKLVIMKNGSNPKELWLPTILKVCIAGRWRRVYRYNPAHPHIDKGSMFVGRSLTKGTRVWEYDV